MTAMCGVGDTTPTKHSASLVEQPPTTTPSNRTSPPETSRPLKAMLMDIVRSMTTVQSRAGAATATGSVALGTSRTITSPPKASCLLNPCQETFRSLPSPPATTPCAPCFPTVQSPAGATLLQTDITPRLTLRHSSLGLMALCKRRPFLWVGTTDAPCSKTVRCGAGGKTPTVNLAMAQQRMPCREPSLISTRPFADLQ